MAKVTYAIVEHLEFVTKKHGSSVLCVFNGGDRVSLDGVVARDLVSGRGPRRSRGRDGVGTCSDGTKPNLPYRLCS